MATKTRKKAQTTELKSRELADQLKEHLSINDSGVIEADEDFADLVLKGTGLTVDQVKKYQERNAEVTPAVALAGSELARDHFKNHEEQHEVALSYRLGHDSHHVMYNRGYDNVEPSMKAISDVHAYGDNGELQRVHDHVIQSFYDDL